MKKIVLFILGVLVAATICVIIVTKLNNNEVNVMREETHSQKVTVTIEQIKTKYENKFLSIEGVVGVGIGEELGKSVIKVYVVKKTKSLQEKIPTKIEGYPVKIEVTGEFHAF